MFSPEESSRRFRDAPTLLVVEDDAVARIILARWLDRWEVNYDMFHAPTSVLSRMEEPNYQLALIDYHLPYMNGIELIRMMRESADRNGFMPPRFAIHTTDADVRFECRRAEIETFLLKPVSPDILAAVLEKAGFRPHLGEEARPRSSAERLREQTQA